MDDPKDVQENVSTETPSEGGEKPEAPETPPQPLAEDVQAQIQKAVTDAVELATQQATEGAKREIQSAKDKARLEVERAQGEARTLRQTLNTTRSKIAESDPDAANALRMAELEADNLRYRGRELDEGQRTQQQQTIDYFENTLSEHVTGLGIDPKDTRLDWARDIDPTQLSVRQGRLLTSIGTIHKEDAKLADEKIGQTIKERVDEAIAQIRKDSGLPDVVDTSLPAGSALTDDAAFTEKYNAGELDSPEDHARAKKILDNLK